MAVSRASYPQKEVCNHQKIHGGDNIRKGILIFFLCFVLSSLVGCHYREGVATDLQHDGKIAFDRIAVAPFQRMSPEDVSVKAVRCPLCGSIFSVEKYPQDAEKIVQNIFFDRLKNQNKIQIVPPDETGLVLDRISANPSKRPLMEILKKVGEELGADGIIMAYVYRYRERKGYTYSVEQPASVVFEIHLVRVSDGVIVWKGSFDKTQKPLMENMFQIASFFKEQGKWVTVKELATEGIDAILENFPGIK